MNFNTEIAKVLDKHLPANGVGTEREKLRTELMTDLLMVVNKLPTIDMSKEKQDPPNWWPSELNNDWGQYIPKDIQESLTGRQKTWCKAFAEAYLKSRVEAEIEEVRNNGGMYSFIQILTLEQLLKQ